MKKSFFWFALAFVTVLIVLSPESAMAAPGGQIVTGLFKSTFGRIILGLLAILLFPLVAYVMIKEWLAERRTLKHLRRLAAVDRNFDWMPLRDRVTECFHRVHSAWRQEDMSEASDWMTSWYWQNQQLAFLNQWERDGLINHCRVKSVKGIRPLFLKFEQAEDGSSNGSRVVVSISSEMEDYLAERATGKVVEGKPGFDSAEHVWTFILQNGKWVVGNIEESAMTLSYAGLRPEVPDVIPTRAASVPPVA